MQVREEWVTCPSRPLAASRVLPDGGTKRGYAPIEGERPALGTCRRSLAASEILGHSNLATTSDWYSHVLDGMKRAAMARLDDLWGVS